MRQICTGFSTLGDMHTCHAHTMWHEIYNESSLMIKEYLLEVSSSKLRSYAQ